MGAYPVSAMLRKRLNRLAHRRDKSSSKDDLDSGQQLFSILFNFFAGAFQNAVADAPL
jgi:hypothetical protein